MNPNMNYKPRPVPVPIRNYNYNQAQSGDRFFFVAPFLFGALAGGAIASSAQPRPVYVTPAPTYYNNPAVPYASTSYQYYYPVQR